MISAGTPASPKTAPPFSGPSRTPSGPELRLRQPQQITAPRNMRLSCLNAKKPYPRIFFTLKKKCTGFFPKIFSHRNFLWKNFHKNPRENFPASRKNPYPLDLLPGKNDPSKTPILCSGPSSIRPHLRPPPPFSVVYRRNNETSARRGRPFIWWPVTTPRFTGACRGRRSSVQRGPKRHILELVFTSIVQTGAVWDFVEKQRHTFFRMRHKKIFRRGKRGLKSPPLITSLSGGCVPDVHPGLPGAFLPPAMFAERFARPRFPQQASPRPPLRIISGIKETRQISLLLFTVTRLRRNFPCTTRDLFFL